MRRNIIMGIIGIVILSIISVVEIVLILPQPTPEEITSDNSPTPITTTTAIPSATPTRFPTNTPTATMTLTLTSTPTLSTRIAQASIIMPDVTLIPTSTDLPDDVQILAEPPHPIEPLPNATLLPAPYNNFENWVTFESDHPALQYIRGDWTPIGSQQASRGQYHFSEAPDAVLRFPFSGEAIRIRYVGFTNGGIWEVVVNGEVMATIDSYSPTGLFAVTAVFYVGAGEHLLELRNTNNTNPNSSGNMIAIDAIDVYQADDLTLILPNGKVPSPIATPTLIPVEQIELIQAPPSPQPTATAIPPRVIEASVIVGYDENLNQVLDVSEGIRGISVRLVEVGTNNLLAHAFTDAQGFAQLQATSHAEVQLVVPYFGQAWTLSGSSEPQTFTLLLSAGNQPGLIP